MHAHIDPAQLVAGNPVPTIVIDANHRVTHWNRACAVLTGVSAEEMIGSMEQWRAFYPTSRPIFADLIIDGALDGEVAQFYQGKYRRSALIDGAYEAEDFFPNFGENGRWLYFTAAPVRDAEGRIAAEGALPYPPGVLCVVPGEVWGGAVQRYFLALEEGINLLPGFSPELQGVYSEKDADGIKRLYGYVLK